MDTPPTGAGSRGSARADRAEPAADPFRERPGVRTVAARLSVAVALVALDLWSKQAVFAWLPPGSPDLVADRHNHDRYPILGEWLGFMLTLNRGMAWGFDKLPMLLLVGGRIAAAIFLTVLVARTPRRAGLLTAALVLILAGATGNLADNLFLGPRDGMRFGAVRDFIDVYFPLWDWHFPTFNVADACITVGAVFLILSSFTGGSRREAAAEPSR